MRIFFGFTLAQRKDVILKDRRGRKVGKITLSAFDGSAAVQLVLLKHEARVTIGSILG